MNWEDLEKHFSSARLGRYRASCDGDKEIATRAYVSNLLLAEAMMPLLNVLEIALRNGMHNRLALLYERADWWHDWIGRPVFDWQIREVNNAKAKLLRRAEVATPDKIVAELRGGSSRCRWGSWRWWCWRWRRAGCRCGAWRWCCGSC
ncbi:hypothetical protein [Duganella phyllosphaerae]|uniref:hypothetical protein n=1 Tax=Duganella phyllosphaerae TaxID=762836 RepID=UPI001428BFFF|nr:hypothetical protein [Duganella phyllosphaerae]